MKFGFRTPSFKRSLSAMTKGAATRAIKKALLPGYGQKGKAYYTGFEKSAYNAVYNLTSVSVPDLINGHKKQPMNERQSQLDRSSEKLQAIAVRKEGLNQCDNVIKFLEVCENADLNKSIRRAISKIGSYCRKYMDKGVLCGEDLHTFANRELKKQEETAIKGTTQYECKIAIDIINQLNQERDQILIIEDIKGKYVEKTSAELPNKVIVYPEELTCNPNAIEEGETQLRYFYDIVNKITGMPEICLKLLNLASRYRGIQKKGISITLYDFFDHELTQKLLSVKRDSTKFEYRKALEIVDMLKANMSVDDICDSLGKTPGLR